MMYQSLYLNLTDLSPNYAIIYQQIYTAFVSQHNRMISRVNANDISVPFLFVKQTTFNTKTK